MPHSCTATVGAVQQSGFGELRYRWQNGLALQFFLHGTLCGSGPGAKAAERCNHPVPVFNRPQELGLPLRQQCIAHFGDPAALR
jgi:hypothetical protein